MHAFSFFCSFFSILENNYLFCLYFSTPTTSQPPKQQEKSKEIPKETHQQPQVPVQVDLLGFDSPSINTTKSDPTSVQSAKQNSSLLDFDSFSA
jgi:hypothetical protein